MTDGSATAPTAYALGKKYTSADYLKLTTVLALANGKHTYYIHYRQSQ